MPKTPSKSPTPEKNSRERIKEGANREGENHIQTTPRRNVKFRDKYKAIGQSIPAPTSPQKQKCEKQPSTSARYYNFTHKATISHNSNNFH